jgi:ferredoxin
LRRSPEKTAASRERSQLRRTHPKREANAVNDMSRSEALQALKGRAQGIEARLHLLNRRIGEIQAQSEITGFKAVVDCARCVACGVCADQCPEEAIVIDRTAYIDPRQCTGCAQCVYECPRGAISLCPEGPEHWRQAGKPSPRGVS